MRNAITGTALALGFLLAAPLAHGAELTLSQAITPSGEVTFSLDLSVKPEEAAGLAPWLNKGGDLRLGQSGNEFVLEFVPAGGAPVGHIPF